MICPNCQTENPDQAKFCMNCASPLWQECPNCGTEVPGNAKFCFNCAHPLTPEVYVETKAREDEAGERESARQRLIPQEMRARLEAVRSGREMLGERRIVTILFCDVTGSTAAAEQMDPEEWTEIMNGAFEHMIRPVYKYEGTIPRLMGDAITAFFGAPITHEDDPQRAILAGLEIINSIEDYREQVRSRWGFDFNVRVGINTGLVVVGEVGADMHTEYTALGDAVNLAARMEQTAEPGTVLITEYTYKLVAPLFEFEDLGEVYVKGKDEPIHVYSPLFEKEQRGRLRGLESLGLKSPLVGRDVELGFLRQRLDALVSGNGSFVLVIGEAGLGKSRLIEELKTMVNDKSEPDVAWLEGHTISYGKSLSYYPWRQIVRQAIGVGDTVPPAESRRKLAERCQRCSMSGGETPFLETLLAIESEKTLQELEKYKGEDLAQHLMSAMRTFTRQLTQEQPYVLVFDDLHWADKASLDLLLELSNLTRLHPLLVIGLLRPDKEAPSWKFRQDLQDKLGSDYAEVALNPLPEGTSRALLANLLAFDQLPENLRATILQKAEGNPFYVEEVVRTLIEGGEVISETDPESGRLIWKTTNSVGKIEIPENLQTLLIARIDRLEEEARRTLQLASVIGRSFYFRVLETINIAVAAVHSDLTNQLQKLQQAELIHEQMRVPELEYIFRHSLTQEAAYESILHKQRSEFHRQVGEAIEKLFPDRLEEFYPLLAHHFGEAGDRRVVEYATLAGDAAYRLYTIPEAIEHYKMAMVNLGSLEQSEEGGVQTRERFRHICLRLGRCYELESDYSSALRIYEEMIDQSREWGDKNLEMEALTVRAIVYAIPNPHQDGEKALQLAERALELAQELGDRVAEARIHWVFQIATMYRGDMIGGIPPGERSVDLARELGLKEQLAQTLQDLTLAYFGSGQINKASEVLEEARPMWRELGNKPMLIENLSDTAFYYTFQGEFDRALEFRNEAVQLSQEIGNEWGMVNSEAFVGMIYLARGEVDRLIEMADQVVPLARKIGHPNAIQILVHLAWLYGFLGDLGKAVETAQQAAQLSMGFLPFHILSTAALTHFLIQNGEIAEAIKLLEESKSTGIWNIMPMMDGYAKLVETELYLSQGDLKAVESYIEKAVDFLIKTRTRYFLPEALLLKAKLFVEQDDPEEAKTVLEDARKIAEDMGFKMILWRILVIQAQVEESLGNTEEVIALRGQVHKIVAEIDDNISDPDLKAIFQKQIPAYSAIEIKSKAQ